MNVQARIVHLATDETAQPILVQNFSSNSLLPKESRRQQLDDKAQRAPVLWKTLAADFINSADWTPVNEQEDSRLLDTIDPRKPPSKEMTSEELRTVFGKLRTNYSKCHANYHASGKGIEGDGDGDDDFFENFTHGSLIFLYMHKLFSGMPPSFMSRDMPVSVQTDIGCGGKSEGNKRKRQYKELPPVVNLTGPSATETKREEAMANYYEAMHTQMRLATMSTLMESDSYKTNLTEEERACCSEIYKKCVLGDAFNIPK